MKRALLFTGLVRDEAKFVEFLNSHSRSEYAGQVPVYFSTWCGELDNYPAARAALQGLDAVVFEQRAPDLILKGHALHQLASWDLPLSMLDDDVFVYKTRADFAHYPTFEQFMEQQPQLIVGQPDDAAPRHKFVITGLFGSQPFYIGDITIGAMVRDLRRLTRLAFVDLIRYFRIAPEQLIWAPGFIESGSLLDVYMRGNVGLIFNDHDKSRMNTGYLCKTSFFPAVLTDYFKKAAANFTYFQSAPHDNLVARIASHSADQLLWDELDLPFQSHHASCLANRYSIGTYMQCLADGEFAASPFGDALREALEQPPQAGVNQFAHYRDALADYSRFCQSSLNIHGGRVVSASAQGYAFLGADPDWTQARLGTPATDMLEKQVNAMRRTINQLEHEIATLKRAAPP